MVARLDTTFLRNFILRRKRFEKYLKEIWIGFGEHETNFMVNDEFDYPGYKYEKFLKVVYSSDDDDDDD